MSTEPANAIHDGANVFAIGGEPCGMRRYTYMRVEHDWNPAPLNRCPACRLQIVRWSLGGGHSCSCGWTCGGACVVPALTGGARVNA